VNREFLINIVLLLIINAMIKPLFIFGVDLGVQNRVSEGEYGLFFTLSSFILLFQMINDFGIQSFNNRHISRHPHLLSKYFPNLLSIKLVLSLVFVGVTTSAALLLGYEWRTIPLLLILLLNQILVHLIFFLRSNISGLGHYRLDSFFSALDKLLMLFTGGALFISTKTITIERFALSQTIALSIAAVWIFLSLRQRTPFRLWPEESPFRLKNLVFMRALLRQSAPYALVVFLMYAYSRLDGILLERMLPNGRLHADVYAGAFRLLDAANMIGYLFASLLLPMFSKLLGQRKPVAPLAKMSLALLWTGSLALATGIFMTRTELVQLMFPEKANAYRADTLGILIWVFVPICITHVFSTLLTADGKLRQMNRFFGLAVLIDVLLNLWLVPPFQARGAAFSALLTQCFVALGMVWLCVKNFNFNVHWTTWGRLVGYAILLLCCTWLIFSLTPWHWSIKLLALFIAAILSAIGMGLLHGGILTEREVHLKP